MFYALGNPTPCLFRHQISLLVHIGLDRFHCITVFSQNGLVKRILKQFLKLLLWGITFSLGLTPKLLFLVSTFIHLLLAYQTNPNIFNFL